MLRDHTGAPRSLPVYFAVVWLPVLSTLLFGQVSTTLFASILSALVIALVAGDAQVGARTRRLMVQVLTILRSVQPRTPHTTSPPPRRDDTRISLRQHIHTLGAVAPRAPAVL